MTIIDYGDKYPQWELLLPQVTAEWLGPFLPYFLVKDDERKAAEQINERYAFGGWRSFGKGKFELKEDNKLKYPGDPPLEPWATCKLRDETICIYSGDFVAVIQPDRSFDVARID